MTDLVAEHIVEAAAARAGTDDGGAPSWREGLDVLVDSINTEAGLSDLGVAALDLQLQASLATRFGVAQWRRDHPELDRQSVARPIVVAGLPRTGTTLLSYLLDCDPANRSLLHWEARNCVPPPRAEALRTDARIAAVQADQDMLYELAPRFKAQHHEDVAGPTECVQLLSQDFKSLMYETLVYVPTYSAWLAGADYASAYDWHRVMLQHLQSEAPGRWSLKSPEHARALDALTGHYPDVRLVVTHRDPVAVCASLASLVTTLAGAFSDRIDPMRIGRHWLALLADLDAAQRRWRAAHPEVRVFDLPYDRLVADPAGAVQDLYAFFDEDLSPEAGARMAAYVAAHPQHEHGPHRYAIDDFGVSAGEVRERFGLPPG